MSRRILLAFTAVITLALSVFVAGPASAIPSAQVLHDAEFHLGQDAMSISGGDTQMTTSAVSANGERVIAVSNPRNVGDCAGNFGPLWITAGNISSTGTTWQSPLVVPLASAVGCGLAREIKVFLSADGTKGLVVWKAAPFDQLQNAVNGSEIRFTTFNWDPDTNAPLSVTPPRTYDLSASEFNVQGALSADGSRAVLEFITEEVSGQVVSHYANYTVIDMEHPEFAQWQRLNFNAFTTLPQFRVAISADGEVVALSATRPLGTYGELGFREMKIFTCQANCYSARLKTYSVMLPVNQGGQIADLDMNDSGTRLAVTWSRIAAPVAGTSTPARAMRLLLINPVTTPAGNVTSQVQYLNSIDMAHESFDLSPDGTRFAFATDHPGSWNFGAPGYVKASVGTLSSTGKLSVTSTSNVSSVAAPFFGLAMTGAPERVFVSLGGNNSTTTTWVSDSLAMKFWSPVHADSQDGAGVNVAISSAGSRAVIAYDHLDYQAYTSQPVVKVTNVRSVLGASVAPSVSGSAVVGKTLTIKNGTWSATGEFQYQWFADAVSISGETGPTYTPQYGDAGKRITVQVTNIKPGFYERMLVTAPTAIVTGGIIDAGAPGITGLSGDTPVVGVQLGVNVSAWTPHDGSFTYVWKVGTKIVGTSANYTPLVGDIGKSITVTVSETKPGFNKVTMTSNGTQAVAATAPPREYV